MYRTTLCTLICLLGGAIHSPAATVLYSPMESLDGWMVRSVGPASAAVIRKGESDKCVQLEARSATVFLSRELPLAAVRGSRIEVGGLVRCEDLVPGIQAANTAKIHLAVRTPDGVRHHSARLSESDAWRHQGFAADVPESAERVVLNLGLEGCSGTVQFARLLVRSDRRGVYPLDLSAAANADHEQIGLNHFPEGTIYWNGIPFEILDGDVNDGADCIRLRGVDHEDWPARISPPIPVGRAASTIYVLHATLAQRENVETPCAMWSAWFAGGHNAGLSLFEGREIGSIHTAEDLENWKIAWPEKRGESQTVVFGVTIWPIYMEAPVAHLTARAYRGAAPVVLAVTVVEKPPGPPPLVDDVEEGGDLGFDE